MDVALPKSTVGDDKKGAVVPEMSDGSMKSLDGDIYFGQGQQFRNLVNGMTNWLELLTCSHRCFSIRAMQELSRAERYRQYLSLIIVRGDLIGTRHSGGSPDNIVASLNDLAKLMLYDCRASDLVSRVEDRRFAVLLVETGAEGAQEFLQRLKKTVAVFLAGGKSSPYLDSLPVEVFTFPDQGNNHISLADSLVDLYRRAQSRYHRNLTSRH